MSSDRCGECGDDFVWDTEAGSPVCLSCGTLKDPSQTVLDSHIDVDDSAKERDTFSFYHRTTLKNFNSAHGWHLPGQGTHPDTERNKIAMRELISALARRIAHPSLSSRTLFLFELAMERGHFRYGRKARLVAGAALAVALRENQKGETIKDIAFLLNESHIALARVFKTIVSLLDLKLVTVDPSWHLPVLQKYLAALLTGKPPSLPQDLVKVLRLVHLPSAFRIATSLSELVSRGKIAVGLPSPPTACAICILALEAETLSPLPHCGELAKALGSRFGVGREVVMRRYRSIYECVEGWIREIPWIGNSTTPARSKSGRKVAKRVGIARHLKDAVQRQGDLWRTKLEAEGPLSLPIATNGSVSSSEISLHSKKVDSEQYDEAKEPRAPKRRKTQFINNVAHFLLFPSRPGPSENPNVYRVAPLEAASHILTSETPSLKQPPTRLQLLAAAKNIDDITDEELFGEGELESLLRTAEEREVLTQACKWAQTKGSGESDATASGLGRTTLERDPGTPSTSREVLDRLLDGHDWIDWAQNEDKDDDHGASSGFTRQIMTQVDQFDDGKSETTLEIDADDES